MYASYDTKDFTDEDYKVFENIRGFSVRESFAHEENFRGRIVSVNLLVIRPDEVERHFPAGYAVVGSQFKRSSGTIVKVPQEAPVCNGIPAEAEAKKMEAVQRGLEAGGTKRALAVLCDMTAVKIVTKADTVLSCIGLIEKQSKADGYAEVNIMDIYKSIQPLRKLYFENERKKASIQDMFDKVVQGQIRLEDITNAFDRTYVNGLLGFLGIQYNT